MIVDVSEIVKETQEKIIQGRNLEQFIRGKLYVTSELISYSPTRLSYNYSVLEKKKLPVIYDGYVNLKPGYLIDGDLTLTPDSVELYGSKEALDTINYVLTVPDTLNNITSFRKVLVAVNPTTGVKFIPTTVELSVPVDEFIEKELEVPVVCVNLPNNLEIKFFPSSVKIPILVGKKRYKSIDANDFSVIVDYNDVKDSLEPSVPVRITLSPDYIQTKIPIPSEVEYILEQKEKTQ